MHYLTRGRSKHFFGLVRSKISKPQRNLHIIWTCSRWKGKPDHPLTHEKRWSFISPQGWKLLFNWHFQHLKYSCHHINQIYNTLYRKHKLYTPLSSVAVKRKHKCGVNKNFSYGRSLLNERWSRDLGIARIVLLFVKFCNESKCLRKPAGRLCFVWRKQLLRVAFDMAWRARSTKRELAPNLTPGFIIYQLCNLFNTLTI